MCNQSLKWREELNGAGSIRSKKYVEQDDKEECGSVLDTKRVKWKEVNDEQLWNQENQVGVDSVVQSKRAALYKFGVRA